MRLGRSPRVTLSLDERVNESVILRFVDGPVRVQLGELRHLIRKAWLGRRVSRCRCEPRRTHSERMSPLEQTARQLAFLTPSH
jgi:hypothetical protein